MASNDSSGPGGSREEEDSFLDWDGRATLFDDEDEDEEDNVDEDDEDRELPPKRARKVRAVIDPDDPVAIEAAADLPFEDEEDDEEEAEDGEALGSVDLDD